MAEEKCKWILYDYRTICPEGHIDKCDGTIEKPYWRLPDRYKELIKFCPYCGKRIDYTDIDKAITRRADDGNELHG